jgi:hypothetical protein
MRFGEHELRVCVVDLSISNEPPYLLCFAFCRETMNYEFFMLIIATQEALGILYISMNEA